MEEERFATNPNPNSQQKPAAPSILDRFQAMVRDRDVELRNPNPNPNRPLESSEVVYFYEKVLRDLTFNSKPIISELTMIAGDYRQFAEGIAGAICARVFEVPPEQKLPSLYLLDSIVKNLGGAYVRHFAARLPEVFIGAYARAGPGLHGPMRRLFATWGEVFPAAVLRRIEDGMQRAGDGGEAGRREEEGEARLTGIHVNPKYLEGGHQGFGRGDYVYRAEYSHRNEQLAPRAGSATHQRAQPNIIIPPSPTRIGIRRSRSPPPDPYPNGSNGYRVPNPRDLIDAYGGDNREKIAKIPRLNVNPREREWERSEEREYNWESMSPTLSDRNNRRDPREIVGLYGNGSGLVPNRVGLERERPVETDLRRSWPAYERPYGMDERRPVAESSTYHRYQSTSRAEPPLPYHLNHGHEPSKHLPYTGSTTVQPGLGPAHHVHPSHRSILPPHKPSVMPHQQNLSEKEPKPYYPLQNKPDYNTNHNHANNSSVLDVSKPSIFVPNWTPPVVSGRSGQPHQQFHVPPLPPGPPPPTGGVQLGPTGGVQSNSSGAAAPTAVSGLLSTLMAQGLISLAAPPQDSSPIDLDFSNPDALKIRNESAINALYSELARQCTTCGLRFREQEEHRAHMDWHVTKNRVARNRKQKPSRKWFVSQKEWLSGAETLGTESAPGFLPSEPVIEREKEEKETAVQADEGQTECALCGESFEDFYSDETEEWMYKGAVYMPRTDAGTGTDGRRIVHAKCLGSNFDG